MMFLLLSILCSVSIAHLLKYVEGKPIAKFGLFATNYLVGALIAFGGSYRELQQVRLGPVLWLGMIVGGLFVCSYVLMTLTFRTLGVTIPVSLMRLSAVLPTFGSIIFFAELPQPLQVVGIILAFLALPLTSEERLVFTDPGRILNNGFGWGLMLFFTFGISNFIFKIQRELFQTQNPYYFLAIIFFTAFLVSIIVALARHAKMTRYVLGLGIILGVLNVFANYSLMRALQVLPGIVVYPINGVGTIVLSAMTSMILWKERLTRSNYAFIVLASIALLLIYPR
jgi:drug/metabolite transporter (DMT)-like permease